jgi:hypothetical protein
VLLLVTSGVATDFSIHSSRAMGMLPQQPGLPVIERIAVTETPVEG